MTGHDSYRHGGPTRRTSTTRRTRAESNRSCSGPTRDQPRRASKPLPAHRHATSASSKPPTDRRQSQPTAGQARSTEQPPPEPSLQLPSRDAMNSEFRPATLRLGVASGVQGLFVRLLLRLRTASGVQSNVAAAARRATPSATSRSSPASSIVHASQLGASEDVRATCNAFAK